MSERATIDFGIDLGTTNSSIAVFTGTGAVVIRNNDDAESTPSAVYIDGKGALFVGRFAKDRLESDPDNASSEFKLQMGRATVKEFTRTGRRFTPEQLSAEILKSLKADVTQRTAEEVRSAVITVPAAFDLPQCDATRRAADLAGLASSPLLQEPVAAALAYGFQSSLNKVFWLVYDLGGGTFDAAIIQVRDGLIQVVNHGGDNHLGGKLIDWALVDQILIPTLRSRYKLESLDRGNPDYRRLIAKIKAEAEQAKIRLSRNERIEIAFEFADPGKPGQVLLFDHEITRMELDRIAEPIITRSVNICKQLLSQTNLGPDHIEKVVLVGGPTLTPLLRERLSDPVDGLGIPLEISVNPLTVVAQGAAIFAGTQRRDARRSTAQPGQYNLELEYKPIGAETEPLIGGRVVGTVAENLGGFTIEFVNPQMQPPWRSGRLPIATDGTFITTLLADRGRTNTFTIELRTHGGDPRIATPNTLTYTVGLAITDQPLLHSIGVAKANNQVEWTFQKNTPLPTRRRLILRQAYEVRRDQANAIIRIPIVEGENDKADRNAAIGFLDISSSRLVRDVPAGSEIEVTLEMDQSRTVKATAFVPILDAEFECLIDYSTYGHDAADPDRLREQADRDLASLQRVRQQAAEANDVASLATLQRIEDERLVEEVTTSLAASGLDPDAADKCEKRLLDLRLALDEIEAHLEWPSLAREAREQTELTTALVQQVGEPTDIALVQSLEADVQKAVAAGTPAHLRGKLDEVRALYFRLLRDQPAFWIDLLAYLRDNSSTIAFVEQRDRLFTLADKAVSDNDLPTLQAAVRQLYQLLPADQQADATKAFGSTVL
jgi:molecular chaperone DnaK